MIAEKIKSLREARRITQSELARQLGITRNGVNSWEQGLSTPSPASIVELAKFFGVSSSQAVDATGLSQRDVALLAELSERLKQATK